MRKRNLNRLWQGALALGIFFIAWHCASVTGLFGRIDPEYSLLLLPPPTVVLKTFAQMAWSGYLWNEVSISLLRVSIGFLLSIAIAVPLGIAMGLWPLVNNVTEPFIRIFSPIPGVAWIPLAILWYGLGDKAAIFIITVSSVFPILLNTVQGMKDVDAHLVDAALTMGATRWQVIRRVMLPSLIPYLITGFRTGLGFAWRVVIAAEMVGVPRGIGYMLSIGRSTGHTEVTIVTMVCLGLLMLLFEELVFAPLEKHTGSWRRVATV